MPKIRKPAPAKPPNKPLSCRTSRVLVALCLILPPLALVWRSLFYHALLPAGLLSGMAPWHQPGAPAPFWNALIWDSVGQYYPWREFAARALQEGIIPLWNPYQFSGTPFLANGQSALFYPLNLIFWLGDVQRAFGISALLHLVLAGWFAYLFLRTVGVGRFGATVGAVAFQLNGYFITWLFLPTILNSAVWLPLALLAGEKFLRAGRIAYALGAGAALGLSALAGHPQIFLFVTVFFSVYFIARAVSLRQWRRLIWGLASAGGFAILLAGVQLLPLLELLRYSHRAGSASDYSFYLNAALPWQYLVTLFAPDYFGNPALGTFWGKGNYAEMCAYAGIVPLLLAGLAVVYGRGFHVRFFAVAAVVLLLCAFGTQVNWPIYHLIPGMNKAGSPARLLLLYLFSVALLAGLGAHWIAQAVDEKPARWLRARLLLAIFIGAAFAVTTAFLAQGTLPLVVDLSPAQAFADARFNFTMLAGIGLAALGLVFVLTDKPQQRNVLGALLVLLIVSDLAAFGFRYLRYSPRAEVYATTGAIRFLQQHATDGRFLALSPPPLEKAWPASDYPQILYLFRGLRAFPQAVLPPNAAMVYGLRDVLGYDSLYLANYRSLVGQLEGRDPSPPANGNLLLAADARRDLLKNFGVRYLVSVNPLAGRELKQVYDGEVKIYEVQPASARAWTASGSITQPATIVTDGLTQVQLTATLADAGQLVLADAYYPGWQALVDGKAVPIELANGAFRSVPLPAGSHQVDFYYRPISFKIGLFIFLLALSLAAGWLAVRIPWAKKP